MNNELYTSFVIRASAIAIIGGNNAHADAKADGTYSFLSAPSTTVAQTTTSIIASDAMTESFKAPHLFRVSFIIFSFFNKDPVQTLITGLYVVL
jgi:hypothetical protein